MSKISFGKSAQGSQRFPTNTLPLPDCWLEEYKVHARDNELSRFPTVDYLHSRPGKAQRFARWVASQLDETTKACRGLDQTPCARCRNRDMPDHVAYRQLADVVWEADHKLSGRLQRRAERFSPKTTVVLPTGTEEPRKKAAVALPVPDPGPRCA